MPGRSNSVAPVVVGVHRSASNVHAVRLAALEAAAHRRPLCLLHAFNWIPADLDTECHWSRQEAEDLLAEAERRARTIAPDVQIRAEIVEGVAVGALRHASRAAALVVVGDGDLGRYVSLPVEAISVEIASQAECSVIVVRDFEEGTGPVVVGVDGTARGEQALGWAFEAAAHRGAELHVVAVDEPGKDETESDRRRDPGIQAETLVGQWRQKYPGVATRIRQLRGDPGALLVEAARDAALLVVGARGERPSAGLLGPVCLTVLHHAPAPVAIVRGRPAANGSNG
ncbi:MAG TPA: universal stress protein [Micromonosporaceae bacterium]